MGEPALVDGRLYLRRIDGARGNELAPDNSGNLICVDLRPAAARR